MNRDLILGATASILLHVGTLFGNLFNDGHRKPPATSVNLGDLIDIVPPPLEFDEPEVIRDDLNAPKLTFPAPQQIDTPDVVTEGAITQILQPPPPDNSRLRGGAVDSIGRDILNHPTGQIFETKLLDQVPQPRFRTPPTYPFEMRHQGVEGNVLIDFLVDTDGNVLNARAVSSTHRDFEPNAVQAVAKWKFRPGRKDGQNVITHMQVPIVFSLDQK